MSSELNENQLLAIQLMASGHSGREIAAKLNVTPETVTRWKKIPEFQAEVNLLVTESKEITRAKLSDLTTRALNVIEESLSDDDLPKNVKLDTAFKILDRVDRAKYLPTDPKEIQWLDYGKPY